MKRLFALFTLVLMLPLIAHAEKPTPDEVNNVLNYYYKGQDQGPVLASLKICQKILKEGDDKNNCGDEITGAVEKGKPVYIWMLFMVPEKSDKQTVIMELKHKGIARGTSEMTISKGWRYRTWRIKPFNKVGTWTIRLAREKGDGLEELGQITVNVQE